MTGLTLLENRPGLRATSPTLPSHPLASSPSVHLPPSPPPPARLTASSHPRRIDFAIHPGGNTCERARHELCLLLPVVEEGVEASMKRGRLKSWEMRSQEGERKGPVWRGCWRKNFMHKLRNTIDGHWTFCAPWFWQCTWETRVKIVRCDQVSRRSCRLWGLL